jgi:NADPH2:quinone reductase
VRTGGSLVSIAETVDEAVLKERDVRFAFTFVEPHVPQLDKIRVMIESGRFRANVTQTFAFEQVAKAHEAIETGHTRGKIVLQM